MARKILLADDSVTAQNMGRKILAEAGYEVVTVNNGAAALKKVAEQKPELILLDVYMPGYSGLEVCQRLKEAEDTAQIPVLLTVGKLEPFKAEEARRVHADAFIIKPFEATELLTALTKLEEKIIPEPAPKRGVRVAKPTLETAPSPKEKEKARESESGWKSRLRAAVSGEKTETREMAAPQGGGSGFRNFRIEPPPAEAAQADTGSAGLPPDATVDELATIAAVASALDLAQQDTTEANEFPVSEVRSEEMEGTFASLAATQFEPAESPVSGEPSSAEQFSAPPKMAGPWDEDIPADEPSPPFSEPEAATISQDFEAQTSTSTFSTEAQEQEDFEVANALASLVPVNGNGSSAAAIGSTVGLEQPGVYSDVRPQTHAQSGPRWVAQEVPLAEGEAALLLDEEMHNVYAAISTAENHAVLADAGAEATRLVDESFVAQDELSDASGEPVATAVGPSAPSVEEFGPPPNAVVFSSEPEPVVEAIAQDGDFVSAPEAVAVSEPVSVDAASSMEEAAAFAAAASVGYGIGDSAEVVSPPDRASDVTSNSEQDAELAAAWASWRQIRDSVVAPEVTAQLADAAAAEFRDIGREEAAPEAPQAEPESLAAADSAVIANIVESVLAQLKPRLVEEIAKKLSQKKTE